MAKAVKGQVHLLNPWLKLLGLSSFKRPFVYTPSPGNFKNYLGECCFRSAVWPLAFETALLVFSAALLAFKTEHPAFRMEHPAFRMEHPAFRMEHPAFRMEHPALEK